MEISKKTDYALRMLAALAQRPGEVVSVRSIVRDEKMPYSFARTIQRDLALAGIIKNVRGASGGMRLAIDPRCVSVLDIIEVLQGPILLAHCGLNDPRTKDCDLCVSCKYAPIWCNAERFLKGYFASVTLHELVVRDMVPAFCGSFDLVSAEQLRREQGMPDFIDPQSSRR